jgi:hypothetical protein
MKAKCDETPGCREWLARVKSKEQKPPEITAAPVTTPAKRVPLCVYESEPYAPHKAATLGLNTKKAWKHCGHPELPKGTEHVCSCMGCGTRCPKFERNPDA